MPRSGPRRFLPALALMACLCLPVAPAHARALDGGIPAVLRAGAGFFSFFGELLASLWEKTGMTIDPNGTPAETGMTIDPDGAPGETGMSIDPNGVR